MVPTSDVPADLPPIGEILAEAVVVSLPMRTRFRGQTAREAMLLRGPAGWAEFAPFPEYGAPEAAHWLAAALEAAWVGLGRPVRTEIPINATLPAVPPERVEEVLRRFGDLDAVPAVKIKVAEPGQTLHDDLVRFREAARLMPRARLRADANAGWSHPEALEAVSALADEFGDRLEYVEQPVPGVEGLARLRESLHRRGVTVRIAADEAVRRVEDPLRVARLGAADLIVVKVPPLGGVRAAEQVVRASGLNAVVSSALDTSVGLAAGLALAGRLDALPYACGLGTASLFAEDVVSAPLVPERGMLTVPTDEDGLAASPSPDPELLRRHRVPEERRRRWEDRLRAAHAALAVRSLDRSARDG
ncbi:o-succinylbenzoate synthase [Nesterenkonia marinintestina]|uniref:o-succinylbenzoate synthase n=1 Tax=Nesterenkonia marinintestina TaxID=2979865 RepID=UPI0021C24E43|nr:o-succinylbenzoate synthase [Nesterenkonia sp. GX14115]